jgi:hypothetical protein
MTAVAGLGNKLQKENAGSDRADFDGERDSSRIRLLSRQSPSILPQVQVTASAARARPQA